jgi:hypothetical protein
VNASNIKTGYRVETTRYLGLTRQFIGHRGCVEFFRINALADSGWLTENPRVGGSIPPLANIKSNSYIGRRKTHCPISLAVHLKNETVCLWLRELQKEGGTERVAGRCCLIS